VKALVELFFIFSRIGLLTFGGGYAILPVIERELITKRHWVTMAEVLDYYTIGQVTPGVIAVNTATFIGYKRRGPVGGVAATLGFIFPSLFLVSLIAAFLVNFAEIPAVKHAFRGIRVAVGVLILDTVLKMMKGVFASPKTIIIYAAAFLLSIVFSVSPAVVVIAAGCAGVLFLRGDSAAPGAPPAVPPAPPAVPGAPSETPLPKDSGEKP
jgi:chromate transporter